MGRTTRLPWRLFTTVVLLVLAAALTLGLLPGPEYAVDVEADRGLPEPRPAVPGQHGSSGTELFESATRGGMRPARNELTGVAAPGSADLIIETDEYGAGLLQDVASTILLFRSQGYGGLGLDHWASRAEFEMSWRGEELLFPGVPAGRLLIVLERPDGAAPSVCATRDLVLEAGKLTKVRIAGSEFGSAARVRGLLRLPTTPGTQDASRTGEEIRVLRFPRHVGRASPEAASSLVPSPHEANGLEWGPLDTLAGRHSFIWTGGPMLWSREIAQGNNSVTLVVAEAREVRVSFVDEASGRPLRPGVLFYMTSEGPFDPRSGGWERYAQAVTPDPESEFFTVDARGERMIYRLMDPLVRDMGEERLPPGDGDIFIEVPQLAALRLDSEASTGWETDVRFETSEGTSIPHRGFTAQGNIRYWSFDLGASEQQGVFYRPPEGTSGVGPGHALLVKGQVVDW